MRFSKKIVRSFLPLILVGAMVLCFIVRPIAALAEEEDGRERTTSELYALSAVLMDADNGRILLEKNGGEILPMASTTKIMTCILALEQADMEDYVSVSAYAAGMPKVHLGVRQGEVFRLKDLMYSLMLESHNDAAVVIAEHVGNCLKEGGKRSADNSPEESKDSVLRFTSLMNAMAKELGCMDTFFVTPNGLDGIQTVTDENGNSVEHQHSTTAQDLARIMRYCISQSPKREEFLEITRTPDYSFCDYELGADNSWNPGGRQFSCTNHNTFLGMMEGALSGKTGFTGKAGYCYVGALTRDGKTFTIALLACGWPNHKSWKWHDAKLLYEYALASYEEKDIYREETPGTIPVTDGVADEVPLKQAPGQIRLLLCEQDEIRTEMELAESLKAPVEEGKNVGWQHYYINGEPYAQIPILTAAGVAERTYRYVLQDLFARFSL